MNLKILDFDKLSSLPYRLAIKSRLNNKLNSVSICGWDYYNSIWNTELFKKIQHILENSEGKHIDDVFSKISKMIPNNFPYSNHYILTRTIRYDERIKYKYWNKETDVYGTLYINLNGIICRTKRKPYKYKRTYNRSEWVREYRRKKKRTETINTTLTTLLNRPLLFKFYKELIQQRSDILLTINNLSRLQYDNSKKNTWWVRYNNIRFANKNKLILEAENSLKKVEDSMQKIENKDYTIFYDSDLYRYSIQKECHHFDQLIKNETTK